jgi:hypothetical protein
VSKYQSLKGQQSISAQQTTSPEKLAQQKQEAVSKTVSARPAAHQGDIFTSSIAAYFRRQISSTMNGPEGPRIRASLRHAEPLPNISLKVNAPYPAKLPLQSTPAGLLLNLPQLPNDLQYRVVGSKLVLYDETSNLVVDFIPGAITLVEKKK